AALHQIAAIGASGVLGRELHILTERFGVSYSPTDQFQDFLARLSQLVLQVNVRGGEERMDAGTLSLFQGFPGPVNVKLTGACECRNHRTADLGRHGLDSIEVTLRSDRETGFEDVHVQALELMRHFQLLLEIHAAAGRLLTVTQSGIENEDLLGHIASETSVEPFTSRL